MPISEVYNIDRMDFLKKFPDNFFDLIIDDPPYGIGEDGSKNSSRSKIAMSKSYAAYSENDKEEYLKNLFEFLKIKSFGVQIIL